MDENNIIKESKKENKIITCYNCDREIDVSDLSENSAFKCKNCYTTLIVADYFQKIRERLTKHRDKWAVVGGTLGLLPMVILVALTTTHPLILTPLYMLMSFLIIYSFRYFRKRAADIIIGILFAEIGVYSNITRLVFLKFSNPSLITSPPELTFQIYFFLITGSLFIFFGLRRRKLFELR